MGKRKVKVYIAVSLDGYIAHSDGNIDWLDSVARPDEDYGYDTFIETIDTVIMGRKTYEKVLSFGGDFPHASRDCYVLTRTERRPDGQVRFYSGSPEKLLDQIRSKPGKDIFIDGGSEAIDLFRKKGLIDSYTVSIIPILLGEGIPLFKESNQELPLKLVAAKTFDSGLVQLTYEPIKK
ncbi:dihydrofolate reductase family protein [Trichococcus alkaliphilus]|uniref:dihydrofolate reductase family protein n=1 Tax=Trichococcus alkaliphilus TaxID=2052943 RepID=UPI000D0B4EBC|nr:dihydrofolate reductase family protein [Trichococcus alkaliphilus]